MDQSIVVFGLFMGQQWDFHNHQTTLHNARWAIFDDNSLSRLHITAEQRAAVSSGVFIVKLQTSLWNALLESWWKHYDFVVIMSITQDTSQFKNKTTEPILILPLTVQHLSFVLLMFHPSTETQFHDIFQLAP